MSIVRHQQEIGSNPIGIGEIIRSKHNPYWKSEEWEEVYEKALLKLSLKPNFLVLLTN